jgi:hypothetical protein
LGYKLFYRLPFTLFNPLVQTKEIKMRDSKETKAKMKDIAPGNEIDPILTRIEKLEELCTQLETTLKDTVTFDALAARITGKKTLKKRRAKREWSPEEK